MPASYNIQIFMIIGWAIECWHNNGLETRYIRQTEADADVFLNNMTENNMFGSTDVYKKVPIYEA